MAVLFRSWHSFMYARHKLRLLRLANKQVPFGEAKLRSEVWKTEKCPLKLFSSDCESLLLRGFYVFLTAMSRETSR
jgi:hypothetical protein